MCVCVCAFVFVFVCLLKISLSELLTRGPHKDIFLVPSEGGSLP